jgi:hypothetical protein
LKNHKFDPNKKITKVEVIINKDEDMMIRINFYFGEELLVKVGSNDEYVEICGGRTEIF